MTSTKYHLGVAKRMIILWIKKDGGRNVLEDTHGMTDDELIQMIHDDPREVFTSGCDNQDERGCCKGHELKPFLRSKVWR